jgi:hypothetical protein
VTCALNCDVILRRLPEGRQKLANADRVNNTRRVDLHYCRQHTPPPYIPIRILFITRAWSRRINLTNSPKNLDRNITAHDERATNEAEKDQFTRATSVEPSKTASATETIICVAHESQSCARLPEHSCIYFHPGTVTQAKHSWRHNSQREAGACFCSRRNGCTAGGTS